MKKNQTTCTNFLPRKISFFGRNHKVSASFSSSLSFQPIPCFLSLIWRIFFFFFFVKVLHRVRIHTGNWGTGAFGNDRVLMALIQMLAARLAKVRSTFRREMYTSHVLLLQIDEVTYHSFDAAGTRAYNEAMQLMQKEIDANPNVCQTGEAVVEFLEAKKFIWGESDGN